MPINPGQPTPGRTPIGPTIQTKLPEETIQRLDNILHAAQTHYKRTPKHLRTRSALLRSMIHDLLPPYETRLRLDQD